MGRRLACATTAPGFRTRLFALRAVRRLVRRGRAGLPAGRLGSAARPPAGPVFGGAGRRAVACRSGFRPSRQARGGTSVEEVVQEALVPLAVVAVIAALLAVV